MKKEYFDFTKEISNKESQITRLEMQIYKLSEAKVKNSQKISELEAELKLIKNQ